MNKDKKIKVLQYGYSSNLGGIENIVLNWVKRLPSNIQFDFLNEEEVPLACENLLKEKGCNIYYTGDRYKNPIAHYNRMKKIIEEGNYDYVHCHVISLDEPYPFMIANGIKDTKAIFHIHTNIKTYEFTFKEKILKSFTLLMLSLCKYNKLACSDECGKAIFGNKKYTVIENGIDYDRFSFNKKQRVSIRKKYGIKDNEIVIGNVGNYQTSKNHPFIAETFFKLLESNDNLRLLLVGDTDGVESILEESGISNRTIRTGQVDNVEDFYSAMDIFYLPSRFEGFPISIVEAQANGLPCIVSDAISKEVKLSDAVYFVPLIIDEAVKSLKKVINEYKDRSNTDLTNLYDVENTSKKMFNYYVDNRD